MAMKLNSINNLSEFGTYAKSLDLSHDKMHLKSKLTFNSGNIIVNSTSLANKYWDYILNTCYEIELSDIDYLKYRYQPKLYCYHKFGTTELWSLLLKVNNITSVAEFNMKKFLTFTDRIFTVLNEIMILEEDNIAKNNVDIS